MKKLVFLASILLIVLGACAPFSGPLPGVEPPTLYVQHVPSQGEFPYSMDLGSNTKSVYFVFTNPDTKRSASMKPSVTGSGNAKSLTGPSLPPAPSKSKAISRIAPTPAGISEFNRDPFSSVSTSGGGGSARSLDLAPPAPLLDTVGDNQSWYDALFDSNGNITSMYSLTATCRAIIVNTDIGKTLNIWVADNCWSVGGSGKADYVTQAMVDALAAKFLKTGASNDIYDWVSGMIGAEWGPQQYANLIQPNNEITILLLDIENDNSPNGGIVGYFWSKDNFVKGTNPGSLDYYSHQRIMFYIDAVMFANDTSGAGSSWSPTGYWPEEIYSTLAHEFQHMINFYQKAVLHGLFAGCDTWINEMCSQGVEDLVADKLAVMGPRGVDGSDGTAGSANNPEGRIPLFNSNPDISLSNWGASGLLESYSATYSFGAYLLRNFGGAALMKAMVQDAKTDGGQIVDAVSAFTGRTETLSQIFQRWSVAVLLSDRTDAPAGYRYNTGTFFTSTGGSTSYNLGSINFFNYQQYGLSGTGPVLFSGNGSVGSTAPLAASGTLYSALVGASGKKSWTIDLPASVNMSVVVK
jgi:hypothetical protein